MPTPPYAKVLVSVNGGATVSGGIEVPSGATIQLSGENVSYWSQQRWEIYEYPEGWATPSGWSAAENGTIFSTSVTPAAFTLPANTALWGKWFIRLAINKQVES